MILLWEQLTPEEQERVRAAERAVFKKPLDEAIRLTCFWKPDPPRCHYALDCVRAPAVRAGELFGREEAHAPTPAPVVAEQASEERTKGTEDHAPAAGEVPHVAAPFMAGGGGDAPKAWKPCGRCGSRVGCGGC